MRKIQTVELRFYDPQESLCPLRNCDCCSISYVRSIAMVSFSGSHADPSC